MPFFGRSKKSGRFGRSRSGPAPPGSSKSTRPRRSHSGPVQIGRAPPPKTTLVDQGPVPAGALCWLCLDCDHSGASASPKVDEDEPRCTACPPDAGQDALAAGGSDGDDDKFGFSGELCDASDSELDIPETQAKIRGDPLLACGCACRGDSGWAHLSCLVEYAVARSNTAEVEWPGRLGDRRSGWHTCPTCKMDYTGKVQLQLAQAWFERVKDRPRSDPERLDAQGDVGIALVKHGRHEEAAELFREVLTEQRQSLGEGHPHTLNTASNLGGALCNQGRYADAVPIVRETLKTQKEVLGPHHPNTLRTSTTLGATLNNMGSLDESYDIYVVALDAQRQVLGDEHPSTLATTANLSNVLYKQGLHQEATKQLEETLEAQKRVLGPQHPSTVSTASRLATAQQAVKNRVPLKPQPKAAKTKSRFRW